MSNGTLWLEIESEAYEVECDFTYCVNGLLKHDILDAYHPSGRKCPKCHGSGTRSVRLEGLVEVEVESVCDRPFIYPVSNRKTHGRSKKGLATVIMARHKAGTLPASLYYRSDTNPRGLREVPHETNP